MGDIADVGIAEAGQPLQQLIRLDQLLAVRRNVRAAIATNIVVSLVVLFFAYHSGEGRPAALWFTAAMGINLIRLLQCAWQPAQAADDMFPDPQAVQRHLHGFAATAFISGSIWAFLPSLAGYFTTPQTLFYLTVVCGITAGAITHGAPYAPIPRCFITPPLASVFLCLMINGSFMHHTLAATVLIYTLAMLRFAGQAEAGFREASRLKHEAVALAQSVQQAHRRALDAGELMSERLIRDPLTGLFNRAGFMEQVEARLLERTLPFCLMILDLDGFKSVNEVYGHHAGDRVLVEVARRLRQALGEPFILGRLGGDEFAVFYDDAGGMRPSELATRLVASIEVPFVSFDVGRLGISVGVYAGDARDLTEMLTCADEALRAAKSAGRNRHYVFDEVLRRRLEMRRDIERDLKRALAEQRLEMWYQPIVSQATRQVVSLEALLRWNHPQHGPIPPDELILAAAKAGFADPLLRYVLAQVCAMIGELAALRLDHVPIAMNISPREISRLPIDEILLESLRDFGLAPELLEIEITEETALDIRSVQDKLIRLGASGIKITIDDFGVGYASFATLRQPYIKQIKIDRSFVRGIADSPENQILVQSIFGLGRSMGVQVVAEGVETAADLEWLARNNGSLVQGYYLQPPVSKAAILDWLQRQRV